MILNKLLENLKIFIGVNFVHFSLKILRSSSVEQYGGCVASCCAMDESVMFTSGWRVTTD